MNYEDLAEEYFLKGYNCSQSVAAAFADVTGMDADTLLKLSCAFGGGFARQRNICGAVSGMGLVMGLLTADATPGAKKDCYALMQKMSTDFSAEFGSIICSELLSGNIAADHSPVPAQRTPEYYHKRSCKDCVRFAAKLVSEEINKNAEHL